jgi:hypothetical protein
MKNLFNRLFSGQTARSDAAPRVPPGRGLAANPATQPVIVVSGLPRSGTSMMMKMLEAGGLPVLIDGLRAADPDNPEGYYEMERVKALDKGDAAWIADARGKGVKVISALLEHLPTEYTYRVIFMHRRIDEVLASQRKMLARRGEPVDAVPDEQIAALFAKHVAKVQEWLRSRPNFALLDVDYNAMLKDPAPYVAAVDAFLDDRLDPQAMLAVINPDLYRNRT